MMSKMVAIKSKLQPDIKFSVSNYFLIVSVVFGKFDWYVIVVFQRCKILKLTSKMAVIKGLEITCFCYDTLHGKITDSYFL